jgi:hypothetical protein
VVPVTLTSIARYLLKITLISAFVVTSVHFFLSQNLPSGWWQLTIGGVFNFVLVGMAIFVIERRGVLREVTDLVRMTKP